MKYWNRILKVHKIWDLRDDFNSGRYMASDYYSKYFADLYINHQKRERCIALADKCYAQSLVMYLKRDTEPVKECAMWYHRRGLWWEKWKRKWFALADKFKEAK